MASGKGNKFLGIIIAIAIIVIVLAIVVPAWHSRQTHNHLNAALDAASAAKLVVEEAATVKGVPPAELSEGFHEGAIKVDSPYVKSMRLLDGGRIEVHTRDTGASPDPVLLLTPTQASDGVSILWQCRIEEGATSPSSDGCVAKVGDAATAASSAPAAASSIEPVPAAAASAVK